MAKEKSPAFQFYPSDFMTDERVNLMLPWQRGAYIMLLSYCWREGSIPNDWRQCVTLARLPLENLAAYTTPNTDDDWKLFQERMEWMLEAFVVDQENPDRLIHPRLERERQKQTERRNQASEAAFKSVSSRKNKRALNERSTRRTKPRSTTADVSLERPFNSSSSSSSSSSSPEKNTHKTRARPDPEPFDFDGYHPDQLADWLAENYPRHLQTKPGWRNVLGEICKTPEIDARIRSGLEACKRSAQWKRGVIPQLFKWLSELQFDAPPPENEVENDPDPYGISALERAGKLA